MVANNLNEPDGPLQPILSEDTSDRHVSFLPPSPENSFDMDDANLPSAIPNDIPCSRPDRLQLKSIKSSVSRNDSRIDSTFESFDSTKRRYIYSTRSPFKQDSFRTDVSSGFGTMSESSSILSLNSIVTSESNADVYKGEWVENKRTGHGIGVYATLDKFVGRWHENSRSGYGIFIVRDGEKSEGKWKDNSLTFVFKKKMIGLPNPRRRRKFLVDVELAKEAAKISTDKSRTAMSRGVISRKIADGAKKAAIEAQQCATLARIRGSQYGIDYTKKSECVVLFVIKWQLIRTGFPAI